LTQAQPTSVPDKAGVISTGLAGLSNAKPAGRVSGATSGKSDAPALKLKQPSAASQASAAHIAALEGAIMELLESKRDRLTSQAAEEILRILVNL